MLYGKTYLGESTYIIKLQLKWLKTPGLPILVWSYVGDHKLLAFGSFKIQNGKQIRFWEDIRIGDKPLMMSYSILYRIARKEMQRLSSVFLLIFVPHVVQNC